MPWASILWNIVKALAMAVLSYLVSPKPTSPEAAEPEEADDRPTAAEGTGVILVWGTGRIPLNFVFYGESENEQIKK